MAASTIHLSSSIFDLVTRKAAAQKQSPDDFVEQLLVEHLKPRHPYVQIEESRSGARPMIAGTGVGVDVVVGYYRAGHSAEEIAEMLPHITLAQIYDALGYYADNRAEMDAQLAAHSPTAWRDRLYEQMGESARTLLAE